VDVLPPEIIGELAGLQDEVPAEPFTRLEPALRAALGTDWRSRFAEFDESTVAAASFGQAYRARLKGEGETPGEHIVTKVQRRASRISSTDLSAPGRGRGLRCASASSGGGPSLLLLMI
jgi:predicted unusual protein kinase regulating ubiquinone biosynthesis (AarF/ABC1/UbiB family)